MQSSSNELSTLVSGNIQKVNKREPLIYALELDSWYYLPTPPLGQDMTQGQIFKRSLTSLNSEFSFS